MPSLVGPLHLRLPATSGEPGGRGSMRWGLAMSLFLDVKAAVCGGDGDSGGRGGNVELIGGAGAESDARGRIGIWRRTGRRWSWRSGTRFRWAWGAGVRRRRWWRGWSWRIILASWGLSPQAVLEEGVCAGRGHPDNVAACVTGVD